MIIKSRGAVIPLYEKSPDFKGFSALGYKNKGLGVVSMPSPFMSNGTTVDTIERLLEILAATGANGRMARLSAPILHAFSTGI